MGGQPCLPLSWSSGLMGARSLREELRHRQNNEGTSGAPMLRCASRHRSSPYRPVGVACFDNRAVRDSNSATRRLATTIPRANGSEWE
jgi:hypothetical protein